MPGLVTSDGERLHAEVWPGGPDWVVLAHGFTGSTAKPAVRRAAERLSRSGSVLAYDARGHGRSTGSSTLGDREVLDVDAAVGWARAAGARRVVTCGFSMGAATVLRHAALRDELAHPPDAVVSVSATSRWFVKDTKPMRRLHRVVETRTGRAVARRWLGTRISATGWDPLPFAPFECVGRIAPVPLLLVHGDADSYFGVDHALRLHAAAGPPVRLWVEPGMGHAETGATPELLDRIGGFLPELLELQP